MKQTNNKDISSSMFIDCMHRTTKHICVNSTAVYALQIIALYIIVAIAENDVKCNAWQTYSQNLCLVMTVFYIVAAIILYFFLQKKVSRSFTIPDTAELRDERDERKMVNIVMDKATADAKKIARMYCGYYIIPTLIVIPLLVFIMIDDEILIRQTIKYITRMLFWGIIVSYFSYNMLHNAIIDAVKDTWVEFLKSMKTDDTNIAIKAEVAKPSIQSFFVIPITGIAGFAVLYKLGAGAEYTILVLSLTLIELVVITKQYMREYKNWRKNE